MSWEDISSLCFTKFLMGVFSLVKIIKDTIQARFIKGTQLTIFSLHKISFMIQMKNFPLCYTSSNSLIQNNLTLIWKVALVGKTLTFEDYIFNITDKVWKCQLLSHVQLFTTPWILACQAPLSMGIPRQEYWTGLLCLPPGDLLEPEVKPVSLMSPELAGQFLYH